MINYLDETEYSSLKIAKLLKRIGYDIPCPFYRDENGELKEFSSSYTIKNLKESEYLAPSLFAVVNWIRNVFKIEVYVYYTNENDTESYVYLITKHGYGTIDTAKECNNSYKQVLNKGIETALNIIDLKKELNKSEELNLSKKKNMDQENLINTLEKIKDSLLYSEGFNEFIELEEESYENTKKAIEVLGDNSKYFNLFPNTNGTLLLVASNKYTGDDKCASISIGNEEYSYYSSDWSNPRHITTISGVYEFNEDNFKESIIKILNLIK